MCCVYATCVCVRAKNKHVRNTNEFTWKVDMLTSHESMCSHGEEDCKKTQRSHRIAGEIAIETSRRADLWSLVVRKYADEFTFAAHSRNR